MASSIRFNPKPINSARKLLHSDDLYECIYFEKANFFNSDKFQIRLEGDVEEEKSKRQMSIFIKFDSDNSNSPHQLYVEYSLGMEFEREREPDTDSSDIFSWRVKDQKACVLLKSLKLEKSTEADTETKEMLISLFPVKMDITTPTNMDSTAIDWGDKFYPPRSDGVMVINSPPLKWRLLPDLPERVVEYMSDRKVIRHGIDKISGRNHYFMFNEKIMLQAKRKGNRILSDANQRLRDKITLSHLLFHIFLSRNICQLHQLWKITFIFQYGKCKRDIYYHAYTLHFE